MVWKVLFAALSLNLFALCSCNANNANSKIHFVCPDQPEVPPITLYTEETIERLRESFSDFVEKDGAKMVIFWLDFQNYEGMNPMLYNLTEYYGLWMWAWVHDDYGKSLLKFSSEARYFSLGILYKHVETLYVKFDNMTDVDEIAHLPETCKFELGVTFLATVIDVEERKDKENCACSRYIAVMPDKDDMIRFTCGCDLQWQSGGNKTDYNIELIEDTLWVTTINIILKIFVFVLVYSSLPLVGWRMLFRKRPIYARFEKEDGDEIIVSQSNLIDCSKNFSLNIIDILSLGCYESHNLKWSCTDSKVSSRGGHSQSSVEKSQSDEEQSQGKVQQCQSIGEEIQSIGEEIQSIGEESQSKTKSQNSRQLCPKSSCRECKLWGTPVSRFLHIFTINVVIVPVGLWISLIYRLTCFTVREEEQNAWKHFNHDTALPQYNDVFFYHEQVGDYLYWAIFALVCFSMFVFIDIMNYNYVLHCILTPFPCNMKNESHDLRGLNSSKDNFNISPCYEQKSLDYILQDIYGRVLLKGGNRKNNQTNEQEQNTENKNENENEFHICDNLSSIGGKMCFEIYKVNLILGYRMIRRLPLCLGVLLFLPSFVLYLLYLTMWMVILYTLLIPILLQSAFEHLFGIESSLTLNIQDYSSVGDHTHHVNQLTNRIRFLKRYLLISCVLVFVLIFFQLFLFFTVYNISVIGMYVLMGLILNIDVMIESLTFLLLLFIYIVTACNDFIKHYQNLKMATYKMAKSHECNDPQVNFVTNVNLNNIRPNDMTENHGILIFKDVPFAESLRTQDCISRDLFSHICSRVSPVPMQLTRLFVKLVILMTFLAFIFFVVITFNQPSVTSTLLATAVGLVPKIIERRAGTKVQNFEEGKKYHDIKDGVEKYNKRGTENKTTLPV